LTYESFRLKRSSTHQSKFQKLFKMLRTGSQKYLVRLNVGFKILPHF